MYHTSVTLSPLTDDEWDRLLDALASKAGRLAALLDGDMPRDVVRAAVDADVALLPAAGDLDPECDCPTWDLPCVHAAALSYQTGWLLDADPFVLFLLRGRSREDLLDELRAVAGRHTGGGGSSGAVETPPSTQGAVTVRAGATPSGTGAADYPTVAARDVFSRPQHELPPAPDVPEPPSAHELLPGVPASTPGGEPVDVERLRVVLARAAHRAAARLEELD